MRIPLPLSEPPGVAKPSPASRRSLGHCVLPPADLDGTIALRLLVAMGYVARPYHA